MFGAVIVEPREHPAMKFVLQNVLDRTPIDTPIIWYHGTSNGTWAQELIGTLHDCTITGTTESRVSLQCCGKSNLTIKDYNELLLSLAFWESIPFETILIFQTDSMILSKDRDEIVQFLKYTYIGAPATWHLGRVGNGGFSIRDKQYCINAVLLTRNVHGNEDMKFTAHLYDKSFNYVIPTVQEATRFSAEHFYCTNPFGCHKPWRAKLSMWQALVKSFPELQLLKNLQMTTGHVSKSTKPLTKSRSLRAKPKPKPFTKSRTLRAKPLQPRPRHRLGAINPRNRGHRK